MKLILCMLSIVAFAAFSALKLSEDSGRRDAVKTPAQEQASVSSQSSVDGGAGVLKASTQSGRTADAQISNAIATMAHRNGIIWADYSTNQIWIACPAWGKQSITLVLYPVTYTIATNCTIPPNVTLQFSHGSCLAPAIATTTTIKGYFTAPMSKIFCNAVAGEGSIRLASMNSSDQGGQSLIDVYPEWWGV